MKLANILLKNFSLKNYFSVKFLSIFGIRVIIQASYNKIRSVLLSLIFWTGCVELLVFFLKCLAEVIWVCIFLCWKGFNYTLNFFIRYRTS